MLHQDGTTVVNDIKPLRERIQIGIISRFSNGNGTVDNDIYFTLSSCCRGYRPAVGDSVSVTCVENVHQKHNWRAYNVKPNDPEVENRWRIIE